MRSGTGWETLGEVWDGSGDTRGRLGWIGVPLGGPGLLGGTSGRIREGSGDTRGGPRRVKGPSGRSGPGQGTLG